MNGVSPVRPVTSVSRSPRRNHGSRTRSLPSASITLVMPVLVARNIGRPVSFARIAAIWSCCHGPIERPYHASLVTLTSSVASRDQRASSAPNASS